MVAIDNAAYSIVGARLYENVRHYPRAKVLARIKRGDRGLCSNAEVRNVSHIASPIERDIVSVNWKLRGAKEIFAGYLSFASAEEQEDETRHYLLYVFADLKFVM